MPLLLWDRQRSHPDFRKHQKEEREAHPGSHREIGLWHTHNGVYIVVFFSVSQPGRHVSVT